jgi:hypothetical protein
MTGTKNGDPADRARARWHGLDLAEGAGRVANEQDAADHQQDDGSPGRTGFDPGR